MLTTLVFEFLRDDERWGGVREAVDAAHDMADDRRDLQARIQQLRGVCCGEQKNRDGGPHALRPTGVRLQVLDSAQVGERTVVGVSRHRNRVAPKALGRDGDTRYDRDEDDESYLEIADRWDEMPDDDDWELIGS